MLSAALRDLEKDIADTERRVLESDRRLSGSLSGFRTAAVQAVGVKVAVAAGLIAAGWLIRRPPGRGRGDAEDDFEGDRHRRRRRARRSGPLSLVQPLMPFLLPLLTPLLDRKVAIMLTTLGLPIAARMVAPLRTVEALDRAAFSGTWFEVAWLAPRDDAPGLRDVTLNYAVDGRGTLSLTSRCIDADGQAHEATGVLRQPDRRRPGELEVSYAPGWLNWWPGNWKDHWVMYVDARYQCAVIGSPERDSLRVLGRTPVLAEEALQALLSLAAAQGFDTAAVRRTPHGPATTPTAGATT